MPTQVNGSVEVQFAPVLSFFQFIPTTANYKHVRKHAAHLRHRQWWRQRRSKLQKDFLTQRRERRRLAQKGNRHILVVIRGPLNVVCTGMCFPLASGTRAR